MYCDINRKTADERRILSPLSVFGAKTPDAPAMIWKNQSVSYLRLLETVMKNAARLKAMNLPQGPVIAVSSTTPALLLLIWSCFHAGIEICPVNPGFAPRQLEAIIENLRPAACWLQADLPGRLRIENVFAHVPRLEPDFALNGETAENIHQEPLYLDLLRSADLILTSGSSGAPKAAVHRLANHFASADDNDPLSPDDRYLQSLPMFHIGGLAIAFRCFRAGAAVVFRDPAKNLAHEILRHRITHLSLVPTQFYRLLKEGFDFRKTALKKIMLGGGVITAKLLEDALASGVCPHVSYGMTETSSQICTRKIASAADISDLHAGPPLKHRIVAVDKGEILVKGDTLFMGYRRNGRTELPLDENGFFHTGDTGSLKHGCLYVTGRIDSRFVSGGENIQPEPIERLICELSGASRAIVTGVEDPEWGMMAVAVTDASAEGLKEKLKENLAPHQVPKVFLPWPKDAETGLKVSRHKIRQYASDMLQKGAS
ncbi:MAG: AMP-binding protein [Succinivibrionaceae bacterium]|nr:AMP-binding protein [Succinivibrionaceae bacterium]